MYIVILFCAAALEVTIAASAWIGLMDFSGNNMDFRWISDNASLTFDNWAPSQPDLDFQECGAALLSANVLGNPAEWVDESCVGHLRAFCEADRVSGRPVKNLSSQLTQHKLT